MIIRISKQTAKALVAHASTDTTRPHLHGLGYCPRAGLVAATDGHRLALYWEADAPFRAWLESTEGHDALDFSIVSRAAVDQSLGLCTSKRSRDYGDDELELAAGEEGRVSVQAIRGDGLPTTPIAPPHPPGRAFPPVWHSVPRHWRPGRLDESEDPRETVCSLWGLHADYLADVAMLTRSTAQIKSANRVSISPPSGPLDATVLEGTRVAVITMPMRL